jgi:hypothetical protein
VRKIQGLSRPVMAHPRCGPIKASGIPQRNMNLDEPRPAARSRQSGALAAADV